MATSAAKETSTLLPWDDDRVPSIEERRDARQWCCHNDVSRLIFVVLLLGGCGFLTSYFDSPMFRKNQYGHKNSLTIVSGSEYYIKSALTGQYLRTDLKNNGEIVMSDDYPWLMGSSFTVVQVTQSCIKIQARNNMWLRNNGGILTADIQHVINADCLIIESSLDDPNAFGLRMDTTIRQYVSLGADQLYTLTSLETPLVTNPAHRNMAVFTFEPIGKLRGVNLGGWFIPEYWMMPSFYKGLSVKKGDPSLCDFVREKKKTAEDRMKLNLQNWITEADINQIHSLGFNSIRLPIGYWNVIQDPYDLFVPSRVNDSLKRIDWCFDTALKYNLSILVDLHGAPGSQNGNDHSGCITSSPNWLKKQNLKLTLQAIDAIAARYSTRKNFLGVELLNEPGFLFESQNHSSLLSFYQSAYSTVRSYSPSAYVVFNELFSQYFHAWDSAMKEPKYYNLIMDLHLYDWQSYNANMTALDHIADAQHWADTINDITAHPIVVGEWSFSTGTTLQAGQAFVNASLQSFAEAVGWYVWTWKVERGAGFDIWDVQYQSAQPNGIRLYL